MGLLAGRGEKQPRTDPGELKSSGGQICGLRRSVGWEPLGQTPIHPGQGMRILAAFLFKPNLGIFCLGGAADPTFLVHRIDLKSSPV